jgi:3-oxoacyl-[acyl-carrier protein] reductase
MLKNKIVLIAGGMGQIGLEATARLSNLGAIVICLTRQDTTEVTNILKNISKNCIAIQCDIKNTTMIKAAVQRIDKEFGRIDVLINSAGITYDIKSGNIESITDEMLDNIIDTNLKGSFKLIRECKKLLSNSDNPLIINISSTSSLRASRSNPIYAASKSGINILTQTLALHLSPSIRVIGIAPGYLEKAVAGANKPDGFNDKLAQTLPLRRIGTGKDVADVIESIITKMTWMTGNTIVLDGGMTI